MPCCAIAVFLIGQICAALAALKTMLGLNKADLAMPGAAAWRPGRVVAVMGSVRHTPSRSWLQLTRGRSLLALAAVELLLVAFGATLFMNHEGGILPHSHAEHRPVDVRTLLADPKNWCGHLFDG